MRENQFGLEPGESEGESQFADSFEFFEDEFYEAEDEFNETGYDEAETEDEFRRRIRRAPVRSAARGSYQQRGQSPRQKVRRTGQQRPRPQKRPRRPRSFYPAFFPIAFSSPGSLTSLSQSPPPESAEMIRLVQALLNKALGLNLPVDGVMNVETRSAIRSFQSKEDSPAAKDDGADADPAEDADSSASTAAGATEPQSEFDFFEFESEVNRQSREYGRWVQQSLNKILGLRLTVDGVIGTQTRSAIRSFQQKQGLTADGIVGSMTESALIRAGAGEPLQSGGWGSSDPTPSAPTGTPDIVSVAGIKVARQIAPQVAALLAAAERDGIKLGGGGFRTSDQQIKLRIAHCGGNTHYHIYEKPSSECTPPTAPPGRSNHEKGLAIDFTYKGGTINSRSSPAFVWLSKNAAQYGLYNLPSEPWHWSVNGK